MQAQPSPRLTDVQGDADTRPIHDPRRARRVPVRTLQVNAEACSASPLPTAPQRTGGWRRQAGVTPPAARRAATGRAPRGGRAQPQSRPCCPPEPPVLTARAARAARQSCPCCPPEPPVLPAGRAQERSQGSLHQGSPRPLPCTAAGRRDSRHRIQAAAWVLHPK